MERTATPWDTVELDAAELVDYISSMPRLWTKRLEIIVNSGTVAEPVIIQDFYGSGVISIMAKEDAEVILSKGIVIHRCSIYTSLFRLQLFNPEDTKEIIYVICSTVLIRNCSITGNNGKSNVGINTAIGSIACLESCNIKDCMYGLIVQSGSVVSPTNCTASGNTYGAAVSRGGIILLSGSTPDLLGGTSNIKESGLIVKRDGTLL